MRALRWIAFVPVASRVPTYARLIWALVADPRVPASRKAVLVGAAGYVLFGRDIIPDDIPVLGGIDDLAVVVLAVEIFDRQPTYDSRVDSLVRVEARRVREKLEKYYADEGRDDPVIVTLPKGAYVPAFAVRPKDAPTATQPAPGALPGRRRSVPLSIVIAATSVSILVMLALAYWTWSRGRSPAIPLRRLTSDSGLTFEPALSADGTLLAYSSDRSGSGDFDIWVQRTSGGLPHRRAQGVP